MVDATWFYQRARDIAVAVDIFGAWCTMWDFGVVAETFWRDLSGIHRRLR